ACYVGIPLSGELVGLNVVAVFASGVVAEILSIPELLDVAGLTFCKQIVILRLRGWVVQDLRDLLGGAQSCEPESATVGAFTANHPDVVGLIGEAVVFRDPIP